MFESIVQDLHTMLGRPQLQEIVKSLLSNRPHARIGRPEILWSVNKLAKAVTKGRRLARLIS